jgi:hypothetical protein
MRGEPHHSSFSTQRQTISGSYFGSLEQSSATPCGSLTLTVGGDHQLRTPVPFELVPVAAGINNASLLQLLAPNPGAQQISNLKEPSMFRVAQTYILQGRTFIGADTIPGPSFAAFSSVMPKLLRAEHHQITALCCLQTSKVLRSDQLSPT